MPKVVIAELSNEFEYIEIFPVADLHVGAPEFQESKFLQLLNYVKEKENVFLILLGDLCNNATKSSVSNVYEETMPPQEQKKKLIEYLSPVANKILAMVAGNHEYRSKKEVGADILEDVAMLLGLEGKYSPDGVVLKVKFGRFKHQSDKKIAYNFYITHGASTSLRPGGALNRAELLQLEVENVDVYIVGHAHKQIVHPTQSLFFDDKNNVLIPEDKYVILTGSWTKWSSYAERKGYRPQKLGCPRILLDGYFKSIKVEI